MADEGFSRLFKLELTAEEVRSDFVAALDELCVTNAEVAIELAELGDYRPFDTIMRSIQRMRSGETRVSGEMAAVIQMLLRRQRRLFYKYRNLNWTETKFRELIAETEDYKITLSPQTKGRWLVHLQHKQTGFCPPWPSWQDNLEQAKKRALICIERSDDRLAEISMESR